MESIGINPQLLIAFIVNFLILFGLLTVVLYKPVIKMLDERSAKIKESLEQAEKIKEQTLRSEDQVKAALESARKDGQAIIAQATQLSEQLKEEAKENARKEAEALVKKARSEIKLERDKAIDELRAEFVDIAMIASEKVINESLDKQKHQKLIDRVLAESAIFKPK